MDDRTLKQVQQAILAGPGSYKDVRMKHSSAIILCLLLLALCLVYFAQRLPDYRLRGQIQDLHGRVYLICEARH